MPQLLTTNAIIQCPHGAVGVSTPSAPLWGIQGGFVLVEGDSGVLSCPFLPPCAGYTLRSMGLNSTTIAGRKALLVTDFNQTLTGLPLLMAETHTVVDDSTPAPLPAGSTAPPLPPELLDVAAPVVVAVPPLLAFNTVTQQPATAAVTFTLTHPFPMQWVLSQLSAAPPASQDVTNGLPPGLVLAPSGGGWSTPSLTVTLTLTALYMNALGIGVHYFYMTGISRRGKSGFAQVTLTVT